MVLRLIVLFMVTFNCYARTTYEQILINKPNIDQKYAKELAKIINQKADEYLVPANVLAGLFRVESTYILNSTNKKSNDYGIGQINIFNIKAYKLDKALLLNDLEYSIDKSFMVFKWFYVRYPLEEAVKRYNCGTRKNCINWKGPKKYWKKIKRYM